MKENENIQNQTQEKQVTLPPEYFQSPSTAKTILADYHQLAGHAREEFRLLQIGHELDCITNNTLLTEDATKTKLYDHLFSFTGAVRITSDEIATLPDGALRNFINTKSPSYGTIEKPRYGYRLQYGNTTTEWQGRAENYYAEMQGKEHDTKGLHISERYQTTCNVFEELLSHHVAIQKRIDSGQLTIAEWKTGLIYLDHLKSSFLHTFHSYSYLGTLGLLANTQRKEFEEQNEAMRVMTDNVVNTFYNTLNLQSSKNFDLPQQRIKNSTDSLFATFNSVTKENSMIVAKALRGIIEADRPYVNQLYARKVAQRLSHNPSDSFIFAGLHLGGIELPFVVKHALEKTATDKKVETMFSVHYSRYSNTSLREKDAGLPLEKIIDKQINLAGKTVVLFDDGILTGKSLHEVGQRMQQKGANVLFSVQSIGNGRRLGQMLDSGGINPAFVASELPDIIQVSTASRANTLGKFEEQRDNGGFDLTKKRTRKLITHAYPPELAKEYDVFHRLRN